MLIFSPSIFTIFTGQTDLWYLPMSHLPSVFSHRPSLVSQVSMSRIDFQQDLSLSSQRDTTPGDQTSLPRRPNHAVDTQEQTHGL